MLTEVEYIFHSIYSDQFCRGKLLTARCRDECELSMSIKTQPVSMHINDNLAKSQGTTKVSRISSRDLL